MVLIEIDERQCSRCYQLFQDGDKVEVEIGCQCGRLWRPV